MQYTCTGTTTSDQVCIPCSNPVCQYNQYATGCAGYQDRYCADFPACAAGYYRAETNANNPGTCQKCTNCSSVHGGLATTRACGTYTDTECGAATCNLTHPCNSTADVVRFCVSLLAIL